METRRIIKIPDTITYVAREIALPYFGKKIESYKTTFYFLTEEVLYGLTEYEAGNMLLILGDLKYSSEADDDKIAGWVISDIKEWNEAMSRYVDWVEGIYSKTYQS